MRTDILLDTAEILCVGTEILIGDIVNTNAAFLSKELAALGIGQYYQAVVGDNPARLKRALSEALERSALVIMTGGLGPTYDDLTKETAAALMGRKILPHKRSMERLCAMFEERGLTMSENNRKQAMMPEGAVVFDNHNGTAPGCAIEDTARGKIVIMLPGPPHEMKAMWLESARPYLENFTDRVFASRNLNIVGLGESRVEELLHDLMSESENPTVAPYCGDAEVRLRITASAPSRKEALALCDTMIERIRASEVAPYIYGVDAKLEEALADELKARSLTLATAESCTGGLIGKSITDVAGASACYRGGVISYCCDLKRKLLGVREESLAETDFDAVSAQVAREMAEGVLKLTGADIAISTTGLAGPGGGSEEKPVGLVYIGIAYHNPDGIAYRNPDGIDRQDATDIRSEAIEYRFIGTREHIRLCACKRALGEVMRLLRNR